MWLLVATQKKCRITASSSVPLLASILPHSSNTRQKGLSIPLRKIVDSIDDCNIRRTHLYLEHSNLSYSSGFNTLPHHDHSLYSAAYPLTASVHFPKITLTAQQPPASTSHRYAQPGTVTSSKVAPLIDTGRPTPNQTDRCSPTRRRTLSLTASLRLTF
jgi:hypothetical protein